MSQNQIHVGEKGVQFVKNQNDIISKEIKKIIFKPTNNNEIINFSEVPLVNSRLYEENVPARQGALDPRMGTNDQSIPCQTCNKSFMDCPGHFGYIKLNLPLFHIGYFKKIVCLVQSICKNCSRVLLSEDQIRKFSRGQTEKTLTKLLGKFKTVVAECKKTKKCHYCGSPAGKCKKMPGFATKILFVPGKANESFKSEQNRCFIKANMDEQISESMKIRASLDSSQAIELTPVDVLELFRLMEDSDINLFHMNPETQKPEDMIAQYILAPPVCIRPTVKVGGDKTNEDDLTIKIYEMLKQNNYLGYCMKEGRDMSKINEAWNLLQNIYTQYLNSDTSGLPRDLVGKNSSRGVLQRLKGKTGRFRGNLSGKRVEFSARTVITPDPNLRIDQVIVPKQMAYVLSYAEIVNERNKERLKKAVKNGPYKYPGANYITLNGDKDPMSLAYLSNRKISEKLRIGDTVHRHLLDDDIILFNRQPSLHKMSIMGFRCKVGPHRTLRFNECVCNPFNADFDGDEMNIHLPQTEEAKYEAISLMGSFENIITPKDGKPLITFTQDFFSCSYLITNKDYFMDRAEFCKICTYLNDGNERIRLPPPAIMKPVELWTGKQLINVLISPNDEIKPIINLESKEKCYDKKKNAGVMDMNDGYVLFKDSELICGNLGKGTLGGSKSGVIYCLLKDNSRYVAGQLMCRFAKVSARWLTEYGMTLGLTDVTPDEGLNKYKKKMISEEFAKCDDFIKMYNSGDLKLKTGCDAEETLESELSDILNEIREEAGGFCFKNLPHTNTALKMAISGAKGSNLNLCQMIACVGQQIVSGERIPNGFTSRSLPHFEINSKEPKARGFVQNSFYTGLTPYEFFFHTMAGREGLIDTAVKTADTGYMQRRLIKALEDVVINYDGSVRNSEGAIIQFVYGDDGFDPVQIEQEEFPFELDRLLKYCKTFYPKKFNEECLSPDNITEFSGKMIKRLNSSKHFNLVEKYVDYLTDYFEKYTDKLFEEIENLTGSAAPEASESEQIYIKRGYKVENFSFRYGLTMRQLNLFFTKLEEKFIKAKVIPGDGVGATTAQSIGEPCTQMTLKTFHFAGVASMNVTLGVPRIKEIINASKNINTPIIEVQLKNSKDQLVAKLVKNEINVVHLRNVAKNIKEVYEPSGCYLEVELSKELLDKKYFSINVETIATSIIAGKLKIKPKHISIQNEYTLRVSPYDSSEREMIFIIKNLKNKLADVKVGGIHTVKRALISKKNEDLCIFAEGFGLQDIMNIPQVDFTRTQTNHILEINDVLGIEAARAKIIEQINYTVGQYAIKIDIRHTNILADVMTNKGNVHGITRYGIAKMKDSTLMLASFEKTGDILFDSAFFGKSDPVQGGSLMNIGTGFFDVLYDLPGKKDGKEEKYDGEVSLKPSLLGF